MISVSSCMCVVQKVSLTPFGIVAHNISGVSVEEFIKIGGVQTLYSALSRLYVLVKTFQV